MREKYYFGWKFTIIYDKPQPNEYSMNRVFVLHLVLVKIGSSRYLGGSLGIDTDLIMAWAAAVGIGTDGILAHH